MKFYETNYYGTPIPETRLKMEDAEVACVV